ncbi:hypothetical protein GCM10027515_05990 [Schumannella luteola]|uniref:DNA-binding MarR family transcriptional regulator n=1 Tax=Schumannella luteola TaxID=472059 RepID=A0A852YKL6_9MICO|nr:DNA-binding MarR family transcriptional regulator [Schumannella luteola]TPX05711.1 MarR family transcriptional regulator [Schumannella luteola]
MTDAYAIEETPGDAPQLHAVGEATIADVMNAFVVLRSKNAKLVGNLAASAGITTTDVRALFYVGGNDDVTPKKVAEYLGLTTGAMTSLVDRNEAAGFMQRTNNPTDRRSFLLELTDAGRDLVKRNGQTYADAFSAAVAPADYDAVHRAFVGLSEHLGAAADELDPKA